MVRRLLLVAFLFIASAGSIHGASLMPQCIMGNGAAAMDNGTMYLHGTIGIPVIGLTTSATMRMHQGFWHSSWHFASEVTDPTAGLPITLELDPARPNPFSFVTSLRLGLPRASDVTLKLYDVTGREVASLIEGEVTAGYHTAQLNATTLPGGVYFCRLQAGPQAKAMRLVVAK